MPEWHKAHARWGAALAGLERHKASATAFAAAESLANRSGASQDVIAEYSRRAAQQDQLEARRRSKAQAQQLERAKQRDVERTKREEVAAKKRGEVEEALATAMEAADVTALRNCVVEAER